MVIDEMELSIMGRALYSHLTHAGQNEVAGEHLIQSIET